VGIVNPYKVELVRLADVSPDTIMSLVPAVDTAVSDPGGAVMLAGVFGNPVVPTAGVPVVTVKPTGKDTLILATLVGVVFNLNVTSRSFPADALIPRRPNRTLDCDNCVALASPGKAAMLNTTADTTAIARLNLFIFLFLHHTRVNLRICYAPILSNNTIHVKKKVDNLSTNYINIL
jgi:CBS-domain-containing membrane protein